MIDTERLDWLEKGGNMTITRYCRPQTSGGGDSVQWRWQINRDARSADGETLRNAIDLAMREVLK